MSRLFQWMMLGIIAVFLTGCAGTRDVTVRGYAEDRPRVDTRIEGNAGYLTGTPPAEALQGVEGTRRFYVLEVTKETPEDDLDGTTTTDRTVAVDEDRRYDTYRREPEPRPSEPRSYSAERTAPVTMARAQSFQEYTVEKGDTLQKISKKFYDSYSKWQRIHDANKDVIQDPNNIKPGIVLRIPMDQSGGDSPLNLK